MILVCVPLSYDEHSLANLPNRVNCMVSMVLQLSKYNFPGLAQRNGLNSLAVLLIMVLSHLSHFKSKFSVCQDSSVVRFLCIDPMVSGSSPPSTKI